MGPLRYGLLVLFLYGFCVTAELNKYRCDFESGLCSFLANANNNKENWKLGRGNLNSADTGPSVDHTLGYDPCASKPCENGGECIVSESSYKCNCKEPFNGTRCQFTPCQCDTGKCVQKDGNSKCTCPPEFGVFEFIFSVECKSCNCGKESNCTFKDFMSSADCICKDGYKVVNNFCEAPCTSNPCKNNGVCKIKDDSFMCACKEPFSGQYCEIERHICETHKPCKNGGECVEKGKDYFCSCKEGLIGQNCTESEWCVYTGQELCVNVDCYYNSGLNMSYCRCDFLLLYNMKSKKCEPCYCGDHGTCLREDRMKTCVCEENYIEKDGICYDPCDPNPCWNFGKCTATKNGSYTCICKKPFTGKICEEQIQPSTAISSTFTATVTQPSCDCGVKSFDCKIDEIGRKRCFCLPGFAQKGNTCSETCNSDADCLNGGTCEKIDNAFFCVCPESYAGDKCQVNAACDTLRMRCDAKRAVCRQTRDGAVCECPPDKAYRWFSGVCEDICDSRKCLNGKCEITGRSSFKCVCDDGFTGYRCDEKINRKEGLSAYIIGAAMLSMAILLSTFVTLCLVCVIRRFTNANGIKGDIG